MNRVALVVLAAMTLALSVGCNRLCHPFMHTQNCGCDSCSEFVPRPAPASLLSAHGPACRGCGTTLQAPPQGPPVAATSFPYYTVRGPRDFLAGDPPSIGN